MRGLRPPRLCPTDTQGNVLFYLGPKKGFHMGRAPFYRFNAAAEQITSIADEARKNPKRWPKLCAMARK